MTELILLLYSLVHFLRKLESEGTIQGKDLEIYDRLMIQAKKRIFQAQAQELEV